MGTEGHAAVLPHDQDVLKKERKERKERGEIEKKREKGREREKEREREKRRGKREREKKREKKREKEKKKKRERKRANLSVERFLLKFGKSNLSSLLEEKAVLRACGRAATQEQETSGGIWQQCVT